LVVNDTAQIDVFSPVQIVFSSSLAPATSPPYFNQFLRAMRASSLMSRAIFLNGARVHRCLSVQARQS
jgi:hypothetical protein